MTVEEEIAKSSLLDNPVFLEAVSELFGMTDANTTSGFADGLGGLPKRQYPPGTPELFTFCYNESYAKGELERNDRKTILEIATLEEQDGYCSTITIEGKMETALVIAPKQSALKKYLGFILAVTVTGVAAGYVGMMVGKKQAMKEKRDLGISSPN